MKTLLSLAVCLAASLEAAPPSAIALHDARIVTVSGPVIDRGTVLVRDGQIAAVGENVAIPPEAWVIEAQGLTVYPGLIDALSTWGIPAAAPAAPSTGSSRFSQTPTPAPSPGPPGISSRTAAEPVAHGPEERPATNSWVRAADLISPTERRIEEGRNAGFTSAVTFPTTGIFGGQGAFINLAGDKRAMVVASPAGQYVALSSGSFATYPGSLMGVIAYIRQVYLDAGHYQLEKQAWESHAGTHRPPYDRAVEGVLESPRALLPAGSRVELERMARFASELKLNAVLYGAHDAYRDTEGLRRYPYPLLVSLKWPERARDADPDAPETLRTLELRDRAPSTPAALAKAGIRFAFYSDGIAARDARKSVKRAIDAGLPPADAVRAMTLGAAEIYGLADRVGSIEKGKIANLVVTTGDLFQDRTQVKYIFIDGEKYEPGPEAPPSERPSGERPSGGQPPTEVPPDTGGAR